ncbi:TfoX/Sxy family protein [Luteolibacter marinus]|uniref:TfoX/Sxy family protein n=1 Tax=Luteolibacter marinus TaxID=2776705 RepID=UPI001866CF42|nr:TfoX/Sxy family protein [Luteolibacter marinus]
MAFDENLGEAVRRQFSKLAISTEEKRMMGGLCFMVDGKMCVGVVKDRLMLRLDPGTEADALSRPGCVPMDFTGRPMKGFVYVLPEGLPTDTVLAEWLARALEFNPRARASKKKRAG